MATASIPAVAQPALPRPLVWSEFWDEDYRGRPVTKVLFRCFGDDEATHLYSARVEWDDDELKLTEVRVVGVNAGVPKPGADDLELLHAEVLAANRGEATDYQVNETDEVRAALADRLPGSL